MDSDNQPKFYCDTNIFYYLKIFFASMLIITGIVLLSTLSTVCSTNQCESIVISISISIIFTGLIGYLYIFRK